MIFNHKYRIGFIHIPRCAGTTLMKSLTDNEDTLLSWRAVGNKHWGWQETVSQSLDFDPNTYTLIATHRNPYERLISLWAHNIDILKRKLDPDNNRHRRIFKKYASIEQFQKKLEQRETFEKFVQNCADGIITPYVTQTELIKGAPEHLKLFPHKQVKKAVEYISSQTGCEWSLCEPRQNPSALSKATTHTDFTRAWCREYYKSDFEQLGYSF